MLFPSRWPDDRTILVAVAALLALGGTAGARADTLNEYRSLIAECRRVTEQDRVPEARLENLRTRLSSVQTVTYPGGSSVRVNTRPLVAALGGLSKDEPSRERFAALEALLTSTDKTVARGDPRMQAEKILSGKEFAPLRQPVIPSPSVVPGWWVRFSKWAKATAERFAEWLNDLLRDRESPSTPNVNSVRALVRFLQFLLYFVLGVAAVVALYLLGRAAAGRGWLAALRKRRRRGDSDLDLDLSGDGIADPLGSARALAAQGAYREAIRMAYIASLRRLQENGLLVLEPNKTNWEYQRDLRGRSPAGADTLIPATRLFDRVWYGRRAGTEEEFSEAVRVHDNLGQINGDPDVEPEAADRLPGRDGRQ